MGHYSSIPSRHQSHFHRLARRFYVVNNTRITFPNTILYNGVAHVIDKSVECIFYHEIRMLTKTLFSVLKPKHFDRTWLEPCAQASERVAFCKASLVSSLPFPSVTFSGDPDVFTTTPQLLQTVVAVAPPADALITAPSCPEPP